MSSPTPPTSLGELPVTDSASEATMPEVVDHVAVARL